MDNLTRRKYLASIGAAAIGASALQSTGAQAATSDADRIRRMKWWHEAKFGMFIHWGLYSVVGRHEWSMENEAIPVSEYEHYADQFKPTPNAAREWAKLAKLAGMKYMVMTTKHHEGFCQFDSKLTDYTAVKRGPGRDLVAEFVEAARAEGMRVGFYYSLMDWHHPDGARCATDEAARRRFVDYIHGQVRELCTNYGKLDVLWYDVAWPLDAKSWESEKMNAMVRRLQPDIILNNRSKINEDFDTPEQHIKASKGRAWESCMTMNDSWGYHKADDNWKSPRTIVRNVIKCAHDGGNYLLNIGPLPDGSVPRDSVRILSAVGRWMNVSGVSIYNAGVCQPRRSEYASYSRQGNTLYMHVHFWPGETVVIPGLIPKVLSAKVLASGQPIEFRQEKLRAIFSGLPATAPQELATTLVIELDAEPKQDTEMVRRERERLKA